MSDGVLVLVYDRDGVFTYARVDWLLPFLMLGSAFSNTAVFATPIVRVRDTSGIGFPEMDLVTSIDQVYIYIYL